MLGEKMSERPQVTVENGAGRAKCLREWPLHGEFSVTRTGPSLSAPPNTLRMGSQDWGREVPSAPSPSGPTGH